MKYARFEAKVLSISSETKLVQLASTNPEMTNEYPYVNAVEPILIEAIKKDQLLNVLASEENKEHLTIIEASFVK